MTKRIALPGDGWADIKDPTELSNKERKLIRRHALGARGLAAKLTAAGATPGTKPEDIPDEVTEALVELIDADDLDLTDAAQAAYIVAYTGNWSLERPLPTMDTVDDLPGPVYDALAEATTDLGDGAVDLSPDGVVDPGSPTVPSPV